LEPVPFQITISDPHLSKLQQKLALTTLPDELDDAGWSYGAPLADVQRLVNRWKNGYDWRKEEAKLNAEMPQFTRDIDVQGFGTLNIHYVYKKSQVEGAIPLLFVHGWPGSFIEVRKVLPLLIEASPNHPSFDVVALSLPGYGFSEAPKKKGFAIDQYAEVGHKLMLALGYDEYVTQGGDWGSIIIRVIAKLFGNRHNKAFHMNMPHINATLPSLSRPLLLFSHLLSFIPLLDYNPREKEGLTRMHSFIQNGKGYFAEQSTQPQTLGYGLADSPVGLLAWIYEKLVCWTDNYKWDDDEVLTWISLYYFSRAGPAASIRIYYEFVHSYPGGNIENLDFGSTTTPLGLSYFPKELGLLPRKWHKSPNLVFESEHDSGGHFAAHEQPEALVSDLRKMFGKDGPAFGIVKEKNGYSA